MQEQKNQQEPSDAEIVLYLIMFRNKSFKAFIPMLLTFASLIMFIFSLLGAQWLIAGTWFLFGFCSMILTGNLAPSRLETDTAKYYQALLEKRNKNK